MSVLNLPKCFLEILKSLKFCLKRIYSFLWSRFEDCLYEEGFFLLSLFCAKTFVA